MAVQEEGPSQSLPKPLDLTETKDEETSFSDFMSPTQLKSHELHYMHRYLSAIMKKREHEKYLQELSPDIHKKLLALKKLQMETMDLSAEFHLKVHVLENEYLSKHEKIFQKRSEIINGDYVPIETECEVSDEIGGISQRLSQIAVESDQEVVTSGKGIPDFWLTVFKLVPQMDQMVREYDEPILKHLTDVRIHSQVEPVLSFKLEFHFSPNEFFENAVLEKEYFMKCVPEAGDPFAFDGPEIYKSKGTEIKWKEKGKNVTMEMREVDGKAVEVKVQSFFNFFEPPELLDDPKHPLFHEVNVSTPRIL